MNEVAVFATEEIFEKNTKRERKFGEISVAVFFKKLEAMNFECLRADVEFVASFERVAAGEGHLAVLS
jgi:hypothetical protein